jgi:hypothetical protein
LKIPVELPDFLPAAVQYDNGGESHDFVLLGQLHVLLFLVRGLGLSARKIQLHQYEIVVREILELRLRQNFLVEFDAPPAPVGSGKIEQQKFVVRFGCFLRLPVIVQPIGFRSRTSSDSERKNGCDDK